MLGYRFHLCLACGSVRVKRIVVGLYSQLKLQVWRACMTVRSNSNCLYWDTVYNVQLVGGGVFWWPCVCVSVKADEGDAAAESEVVELEQQIEMCNAQITDLQQKLIDADQGNVVSVVMCFSMAAHTWFAGVLFSLSLVVVVKFRHV